MILTTAEGLLWLFTLMYVISAGHTSTIHLLVQKGSVVNATDYHGSTPLHLACQRGHQQATVGCYSWCYIHLVNGIRRKNEKPVQVIEYNSIQQCFAAHVVQHCYTCLQANSGSTMLNSHGFIGYPKGRNVERALGFSLTGTVSTSPNLAKEGVRSATIITRPSGSRFS